MKVIEISTIFAAGLVLVQFSDAAVGNWCGKNSDCNVVDELCIKNRCKTVRVQRRQLETDFNSTLDDSCFESEWPNVTNCADWTQENGVRRLESNGVPEHFVEPYCPFGVGQGYCQSPVFGNSSDCSVFDGLVCPCTPGEDGSCPDGTPASGDVLVPRYFLFEVPSNPDPTDDAKPMHMYNNSAVVEGESYQVIGAALDGVQIKGPAEAHGANVDTSLIPLFCGGHVTPPTSTGPLYHYHKPMDCLNISAPAGHGPLIGFAGDGFGIYGYGDWNGFPVLDECNGHFGPVPPYGKIEYHYHASPVTNLDGEPHKPYFMGCQGPSKGRCKETVSDEYDDGADWCGQGCGYDLCVQPGTKSRDLLKYISKFQEKPRKWLKQYSINKFEVKFKIDGIANKHQDF